MDKFKKLNADFAKGLEEAFAKPEVKELLASIKDAGGNTGTFRVLITNEAIDRAGEMIKADGWDFGPYMKSPVVLWGHDYKQPPIGITTRLVQEGTATIAEGIFAPSAFAQEIRQLYDMGIQRAASVGFIPKEMEGNIITKAELLEWSFVAVGCNAEALSMLSVRGLDVNAYAAKGIITKDGEEATAAEPEKKGEVMDEINAEEEMEAKCNYLEDVYEILNAFFTLAYDSNTMSADLPKLLSETADLLKQVADGSYADAEDAAEGEKGVKASIAKLEKTAVEKLLSDIKNGAKADEKLVSEIQLAATSAKTLTAALEGLLAKADAERKPVKSASEVGEADDFLALRAAMQGLATTIGETLAEAKGKAKGHY